MSELLEPNRSIKFNWVRLSSITELFDYLRRATVIALEKDVKKKIGGMHVAVPESVQSCFELSIHFPVFFPVN